MFLLFSLDDTFILVMGMSGAGKSSFIHSCTGESAHDIGHGLHSFTSGPTIHTLTLSDRTVHLIDTPGFDDSRRSDIELLRELIFWLSEAYQRGIRIGGIIYIHSIITSRLSGSALRGLQLFKNICGREAYHGIVFLTTGWDRIALQSRDGELARKRQQALQTRYWADMLDGGGTALALTGGLAPLDVLGAIIQEGYMLVLKIQMETVEGNGSGSLANTSAGRALLRCYEEERMKHEKRMLEVRAEMMQALHEVHDRHVQEMRVQLQELDDAVRMQDQMIEELQESASGVRIAERERIEGERETIGSLSTDCETHGYDNSALGSRWLASNENVRIRNRQLSSSECYTRSRSWEHDSLTRTKTTSAALSYTTQKSGSVSKNKVPMPQQAIDELKKRHLPSRIIKGLRAEHVSAVAGTVGASAGLAALGLCTVM